MLIKCDKCHKMYDEDFYPHPACENKPVVKKFEMIERLGLDIKYVDEPVGDLADRYYAVRADELEVLFRECLHHYKGGLESEEEHEKIILELKPKDQRVSIKEITDALSLAEHKTGAGHFIELHSRIEKHGVKDE